MKVISGGSSKPSSYSYCGWVKFLYKRSNLKKVSTRSTHNPWAVWPWLKCLIEMLLIVIGRNREKHCQQSIKWLKDTDNFNTYTGSAVGCIPSISKEKVVVESLHAVAFLRGPMRTAYLQAYFQLNTVSKFSTPGVGSVPGNILTAADTGMNDKLRDGLRWLNTHFCTPNSERSNFSALLNPRRQTKKEQDRKVWQARTPKW